MRIENHGILRANEQSLGELNRRLAYGNCRSRKCCFMLRGEPNIDFKLGCSFFRNMEVRSIPLDEYYSKNEFNEAEFDTNQLIGNAGVLFFDENDLYIDKFPQLAGTMIIQHHGKIGTPLLDVSYNVYAPLYFACKEYIDVNGNNLYSEKNGRIYLINHTFDIEGTHFPFSLFVINRSVPTPLGRMRKQKGEFIATFDIRDGKTYYCDISETTNMYANEFIIPAEEKPKFIKLLKRRFGNLENYFGI